MKSRKLSKPINYRSKQLEELRLLLMEKKKNSISRTKKFKIEIRKLLNSKKQLKLKHLKTVCVKSMSYSSNSQKKP